MLNTVKPSKNSYPGTNEIHLDKRNTILQKRVENLNEKAQKNHNLHPKMVQHKNSHEKHIKNTHIG